MLIDVVDSTDVGVSDPARQAKLPAEAFYRAFVGREAGAQRLQGDVFVTQDEVFGFVHFAHSAFVRADRRFETVQKQSLHPKRF